MYRLYWSTPAAVVVILRDTTLSFLGHLKGAEKDSLIVCYNPERLHCGQPYIGCL